MLYIECCFMAAVIPRSPGYWGELPARFPANVGVMPAAGIDTGPMKRRPGPTLADALTCVGPRPAIPGSWHTSARSWRCDGRPSRSPGKIGTYPNLSGRPASESPRGATESSHAWPMNSFAPPGLKCRGSWFRGFAANNAASPTAKSSPALAGLARILRRFFTRRNKSVA